MHFLNEQNAMEYWEMYEQGETIEDFMTWVENNSITWDYDWEVL